MLCFGSRTGATAARSPVGAAIGRPHHGRISGTASRVGDALTPQWVSVPTFGTNAICRKANPAAPRRRDRVRTTHAVCRLIAGATVGCGCRGWRPRRPVLVGDALPPKGGASRRSARTQFAARQIQPGIVVAPGWIALRAIVCCANRAHNVRPYGTLVPWRTGVRRYDCVHYALCIVHYALYIMHCALCIIHYALCISPFAFCILHFAF